MTVDSVWAIAPVIFSVIGIVSVTFVISVFVRYNDTPIIMASGRELCYVLMAGMLLCYAMTSVVTRSSMSPTLGTAASLRREVMRHFAVVLSSLSVSTYRRSIR